MALLSFGKAWTRLRPELPLNRLQSDHITIPAAGKSKLKAFEIITKRVKFTKIL